MWRCDSCKTMVFTPMCPGCGAKPLDNHDRQTQEFVRFLTVGRFKKPDPVPPSPFRRRLATYMHCDESKVMRSVDDHRSSMPLRFFGPIGPHKGPKPIWLIRHLLKRIHDAVRSSTSSVQQ